MGVWKPKFAADLLYPYSQEPATMFEDSMTSVSSGAGGSEIVKDLHFETLLDLFKSYVNPVVCFRFEPKLWN